MTKISRREALKVAGATALGAAALPIVGRSTPAFARSRSNAAQKLTFSTVPAAPLAVPIFQRTGQSIFNKTHTDAQAAFQEVPGS